MKVWSRPTISWMATIFPVDVKHVIITGHRACVQASSPPIQARDLNDGYADTESSANTISSRSECDLLNYLRPPVIQLATLSGFSYIIATASLHNTEYLKSLGATHVVDRHISPDRLPEELKKIDRLPEIKYAFDAYGRPDSSLPLAFAAVVPGGKVVSVQIDPPDGKTLAAFTAGKRDTTNPPHLIKFWAEVTRLLESKQIKPANVDVIPGGLRGVEEGLRRIGEGKVSGVKLVVHVEETQ